MDRITEKALHKAIKENDAAEIDVLLKSIRDVNKGSEPVLCTAVSEKNAAVAKKLIDAGANVNAKAAKTGHHPLHIAAKNGSLEITDMLMKNGADIHAKTDSGDSVLYIAVMSRHTAVVEYLLQAGADVNEPASFLYSRNKAIHGAAQNDDPIILNLLLASKAYIDAQNDNQNTALHIAANSGKYKNVERLINCGASVNTTDSAGKTALQMACDNGHVEVVRLLCVAGANMNCENAMNNHPLDIAVSKRYINVVRTLLHFGALVNREYSHGRTALHKSITNCKHKMKEKWGGSAGVSVNIEIEMLDTLLQYGADLNYKDHDGGTPLHTCVKDGCESVLDYLINSGIQYNQVNKVGYTALQLACNSNITPAIQILIQNCPGLVNHVNHVDLDKTPMVMLWTKRNLECLKLLCDAGYLASGSEKYYIEMQAREDRKKVDHAIKTFLNNEFSNPWKLGRICRTMIRDKLHNDLQKKVHFLPVPEKIMSSLLLSNFNWI